MFVRFNYLWRHKDEVEAGGKSTVIPHWLTNVMVCLTLGIFFLAIPAFIIPLNELPQKEKTGEGKLSCPSSASLASPSTTTPVSHPKRVKKGK
jgi:hypothetical protein